MRAKIFEIPNKLVVEWESDAKVIIDTWTTYFVSLDEFREAVMIHGVNYAKANNAQAWIVDSHKATGVFSPEIQKFIESDVFPTFAKIGIKYFMTINSDDAVTRLSINQYSTKVGPHGLKLLKGDSVEGAIAWLKKNT
ncbi:MAG: hypothetical protein B6I20_09205 [Bacteroidetes bacterium 4572_117]|nr:MAG: hypothetical protein B6I20_09205 [Bacteroidetes bacterium 4572_117]